MNYSTDIAPLEQAGYDDATIAAILSAVTRRPIDTKTAKIYFRESDLWKQRPQGFSGKLHTAMQSPLTPEPHKALLEEMWAAVFGEAANTCGTTVLRKEDGSLHSIQQAHNVRAVIQSLVDTQQISVADRDAFYALGGGLARPDGVTAQNVADARQTHADELAEQQRRDSIDALRAEIENTWLNPAISDGTSTPADVRAAIKAGL